jgi:hypothetical protein
MIKTPILLDFLHISGAISQSGEIKMAIFTNSQWSVTELGIESATPIIVPSMLIDASKLLQTRTGDAATFYEWPLHMAEKSWVDVEAFNEAYLSAVQHHAEKLAVVDRGMMAASLAEARRIGGTNTSSRKAG